MNRAVPEARCRVESSVIAVVSISPGISTITPESVTRKTEIGNPAAAISAGEQRCGERGQQFEDAAERAHAGWVISASAPMTSPMRRRRDDLVPAAAEKARGAAGDDAERERRGSAGRSAAAPLRSRRCAPIPRPA